MQAGIGVYKDRDKYLARSAEILRSLSGFIKEMLAVSHMDISDETERRPLPRLHSLKLSYNYRDWCFQFV